MKTLERNRGLILILLLIITAKLYGITERTEVVIIQEHDHIMTCDWDVENSFQIIAASQDKEYPLVYKWYRDNKLFRMAKLNGSTVNFPVNDRSLIGDYHCEIWAVDTSMVRQLGGESEENFEIARVSKKMNTAEKMYYVFHSDLLNNYDYSKRTIYAKIGDDVRFVLEDHFESNFRGRKLNYDIDIQWYIGVGFGSELLKDDNKYYGVNSSILDIKNVSEEDFNRDFIVWVESECNTVGLTFYLEYKPIVEFTLQPIDQEDCEGEYVQIYTDANAKDADIKNFKWYLNDTPLEEEKGVFEGVNSNALTVYLLPDSKFTENDDFKCLVCPEDATEYQKFSNPANISILNKPEILKDLESDAYTIIEGNKFELSVLGGGDGEINYQWYKDNNPISGETTSKITFEEIETEDEGRYYCKIENECGSVLTKETELIIIKKGVVSSVNEDKYLTGLHQNSPNPFRSVTTITFRANTTTPARVTITDNLGNTVATVYNGTAQPGLNTIEINSNELGLQSGTYFYSLEMGNKVQSSQMILIK